MNGLTHILDDRGKLKPILDRFVEEARDTVSRSAEADFAHFYAIGLDILVKKHCDLVFGTVSSPIERIWMNSLQVRFLRDAGMLVVTPPIPDVSKWRGEMLRAIAHSESVLTQVRKAGYSLGAVDTYLDAEVAAGRLPALMFAQHSRTAG
jgi:hypothetical protein